MSLTPSPATQKHVLITGATSGVGRAAATALHQMGHHVVLVGRDPARTQGLADELSAKGVPADYLIADLSSQKDIRAIAATYLERYERLDILINNAGALFPERSVTPDGYERTWALNHLGYFLLTRLLLPLMTESAPARIVNVGSDAHQAGRIHWNDLQLERGWNSFGWRAYAQSKLGNLLFTFELARRLHGTGVTANVVHPGFVRSGLATHHSRVARWILWATRPLQRSPEKGAETVVWLATAREVEGITGEYWYDRAQRSSSHDARSEQQAKRLWTISKAQAAIQRLTPGQRIVDQPTLVPLDSLRAPDAAKNPSTG